MKKTLKSTGAILLALVVIFALSILTDIILEQTGVMKIPFSFNSTWFIMLVILYRTIYVGIGGYLAAMLAPARPMRHVFILACIGTLLGITGSILMWDQGPHWYAISIVILGWPGTVLGGWVRKVRQINRD